MSLSRLTPLSLHPPKHPRRCPPPDPNWFGFRNKSDSWFAFEWGPGARIYIIGLDYVGSDINRGSQRCQGDQGYFVLTDFLLLQFVHCLKWTWQIWKQGHPGDTDVAPSLSRQLRELCELCELLSVTSLIISDFKEWLLWQWLHWYSRSISEWLLWYWNEQNLKKNACCCRLFLAHMERKELLTELITENAAKTAVWRKN